MLYKVTLSTKCHSAVCVFGVHAANKRQMPAAQLHLLCMAMCQVLAWVAYVRLCEVCAHAGSIMLQIVSTSMCKHGIM